MMAPPCLGLLGTLLETSRRCDHFSILAEATEHAAPPRLDAAVAAPSATLVFGTSENEERLAAGNLELS